MTKLFPYKTKNKITVYGGHPDFIKKIKYMLPNVRFIPYAKKPNLEIIRNSRIIFIQNRALCHSTFNVIVCTARNMNIPVKYFSQSSAKACALELISADK